MNLNFDGFSKKERRLLRHAIPHFLGNLVHRNLARNLTITVRKKPTNNEYLALCVPYGDNYRCFDILLYGRFSDRDLLFTVAHETAHIKQFATGERRYYVRAPTKSRFKGRVYEDDSIAYEDQPWEIDAVQREEGLVVRFLADYPEYRGT